jgi:2-keto-3-deoxy-L-fuconate dehydrogenase
LTERLSGKKALITAAGQGIGRAAAELFSREGAEVFATDLDPRKLENLSSLPGVDTAAFDVTDHARLEEIANLAGPLDVLFNCAGIVPEGTILDATEADWEQAIAVNLMAMARLIHRFLPGMIERGRGSIVNMASVASSIRGVTNRCVYGATKAAVVGLTKSVAADFAGTGVRCNAICPGTVDTPSLRQRIAAAPDAEAARQAFIARQPMGRLGRPEEIAALALYLASDEASYTTGAVYVIDGGWSS